MTIYHFQDTHIHFHIFIHASKTSLPSTTYAEFPAVENSPPQMQKTTPVHARPVYCISLLQLSLFPFDTSMPYSVNSNLFPA